MHVTNTDCSKIMLNLSFKKKNFKHMEVQVSNDGSYKYNIQDSDYTSVTPSYYSTLLLYDIIPS